jgi:hypothetical protein
MPVLHLQADWNGTTITRINQIVLGEVFKIELPNQLRNRSRDVGTKYGWIVLNPCEQFEEEHIPTGKKDWPITRLSLHLIPDSLQ